MTTGESAPPEQQLGPGAKPSPLARTIRDNADRRRRQDAERIQRNKQILAARPRAGRAG